MRKQLNCHQKRILFDENIKKWCKPSFLMTEHTFIWTAGLWKGGGVLIYRWLKKRPSRYQKEKWSSKSLFNLKFMVYILLLQIFHIFLTDWLPMNILSKTEILEKKLLQHFTIVKFGHFLKWKIIKSFILLIECF